MQKGDYFGEVSLLFSCRRTATVEPKQYCQAASMEYKDFRTLTSNYEVLKNYFNNHLMRTYDDELKIFLVTSLKQIDYLKDIKEEILTNLAMHMVANSADKG